MRLRIRLYIFSKIFIQPLSNILTKGGFVVSNYRLDNVLIDSHQKHDDNKLIEGYDEGIDVCILSYDSVNRLIDQTHLLIDIIKSQKAEMELLRLKIDILEKKLEHQRYHIYVPGP